MKTVNSVIKYAALIILSFSVENAFAMTSSAEVTGKMGMSMGSFNLGVDYLKPHGDFDLGGYFFLQSPRESNNNTVVNKVLAFGGMIKLNIVEKSTIKSYIAPGFGLAIIEGGSINSLGRKSDENIISPNFRIGVQYINSKNVSIGLERLQFANMLNDSLNNFSGPSEYYSVVISWGI